MRDLYQNPIWRPEELGHAIPPSTHAISVALPRWQDVVGYEEKKPEVLQRLVSGYPRFKIHSLVLEVARQIGGGEPCLPFPSARAAECCAEFIRRVSKAEARIAQKGNIHAVVTTAAGNAALIAFWQHTGLIVSTRQAEAHLAGRSSAATSEGSAIHSSLRRQLAGFYSVSESDVFLAPTGMA